MKLLRLPAKCILSSIFSSFLIAGYSQEQVAFNDKRWVFQSQAHVLEGFQGNNSLYLHGGVAYLKDLKFLNGIIEFDTWLFKRVSFSGLVFRLIDLSNGEQLYLRSHQSGMADAFQYTPVFKGNPAWQLYHDQHDAVNDGFVSWKPRTEIEGYNTIAVFPFDRWLHVKLVIKGTQAELYLDRKEEPVAFIKELKLGEHPGSIGLYSSGGAVYFANFSFTAMDNPPMKSKITGNDWKPLPGTITSWQVSNPFKEQDITNRNILDSKFMDKLRWQNLSTEKGGFINISRLWLLPDSFNTAIAKLELVADKDQIKKLDIGFSDRVKLWCNGSALYSGNANFRSRDFRHLGTIGFFDAVYLPLKKGENTILLAISETFGGWGLMGKLENMEGVKIK